MSAENSDGGRGLLDRWEELVTLIESMDLDVRKNAVKGNHSAGLRARRGLRLLKKLTHELLMKSVEEDKRQAKLRREVRNAC